jgi:hypothetical protein
MATPSAPKRRAEPKPQTPVIAQPRPKRIVKSSQQFPLTSVLTKTKNQQECSITTSPRLRRRLTLPPSAAPTNVLSPRDAQSHTVDFRYSADAASRKTSSKPCKVAMRKPTFVFVYAIGDELSG